jgi:sigma-E factor negative regulatory protein RseA
MNDEEIRLKISLLADEQLPVNEAMDLMAQMRSNPELAGVYSRYLLAGESLRAGGRVVGDGRLARTVRAAIADEPAMIVPVWKRGKTREQLVSLALAAALTGVAVLVGKSVLQQPERWAPSALLAELGDSSTGKTDANLNNYLVTHNETAYIAANGGLLPYLRVVSYGKVDR